MYIYTCIYIIKLKALYAKNLFLFSAQFEHKDIMRKRDLFC